ncbi:unnamed protein product [Timema podura]|uniref:Uncharacterized protein n=1 Tax=Timema podura TaxID=61482 RepID=A0ABN7NU52_TIMPD|nr:unnamed protein product [Timema podura]
MACEFNLFMQLLALIISVVYFVPNALLEEIISTGTIMKYRHLGRSLDIIEVINGSQEAMNREVVRNFLDDEQVMMQVLGDNFDTSIYPTRGEFLKALLERCMMSPMVQQNPELYGFIQYFAEITPLDGYGAQPTNFSGSTISQKRNLDLNGAFLALDTDAIRQASMMKVLHDVKTFVAKGMLPQVHMKDFDVFKYNSRGEVLMALFDHWINLNSDPPIPDEVKAGMSSLKNMIRLDGEGHYSAFTVTQE